MRILFIAHLWPPTHNAGGEAYCNNLAKYLLSQGHEVRVTLSQAHEHKIKEKYVFEGIEIYPSSIKNIYWDMSVWATHFISHLENIPHTINLAKLWHKPVFFISHNSWDYPCINQRGQENKYPVGVVYNSEWMKKKLNYPQPSIVLHPPLGKDKYDPDNQPQYAERITIVNSNERKGGEIFRRICKRMENHKFLFVTGAYDYQITPSRPNAMCFVQSANILPAYKQTRILLVPSAYESWSMACTEAMANGIPVICSKTPGLMENAGDAGIYVDSPRMQEWMQLHTPPMDMTDPDKINKWLKEDQTPAMDVLTDEDIDMWVKEILALDDEKKYLSVSEKCRKRAAELDPAIELQAVEKFIQNGNKSN